MVCLAAAAAAAAAGSAAGSAAAELLSSGPQAFLLTLNSTQKHFAGRHKKRQASISSCEDVASSSRHCVGCGTKCTPPPNHTKANTMHNVAYVIGQHCCLTSL